MIYNNNFTMIDEALLPAPYFYYLGELGGLTGVGVMRLGVCPFHDGSMNTLSLNLDSGAYKCLHPECCAYGVDVIEYRMQRYGESSSEAVRMLVAMGGGHD